MREIAGARLACALALWLLASCAGAAAAAADGYVAGFAVIFASIPLVGLCFASAMAE